MIAVIAAMGKEIALIKEQASDITEGSAAGVDYFTCKLCDKPALVIKSGIGKAAAAAAAAVAVAVFNAEAVINTGLAAGVYERGTVMIADKCAQYDFDMTADGLKAGQIPEFSQPYFTADQTLLTKLKNALSCGGVRSEICTIVSGDCFVADKKRFKQITSDFNAGGVDMESGAVAQVCVKAGVPFAVLRCVSDGGDNIEDYYEFVKKACENFTAALLRFFSAP